MNRSKNQSEPPAPQSAQWPMFHVGKDSHGHWVVRDQKGLRGGLFVDRAEALKFAMFENGNRPQAIIMVPGVLELDADAGPHGVRQTTGDGLRTRRAA